MAAVDELRADLKAMHSTAQHCSTQHLAVAGLQHRLNEWVMMVSWSPYIYKGRAANLCLPRICRMRRGNRLRQQKGHGTSHKQVRRQIKPI
jgi:hypothetical protein